MKNESVEPRRTQVRKPIPLPLVAPPRRLTECTECAKCCTYVAVEIDPPTGARAATDILWYLYHDQVSVYVDAAGDWSVVFETRCRHLGLDRLCRIYDQRPHICRTFDNTSCEVNSPDGGRTFADHEEFLDWLRAERPRVYRRIASRFVAAAAPPCASESPPPVGE